MSRSGEGEFVQSLERGLAVLQAFSAENANLTLSDVAKVTGLTRATARRLLHTFQALGYMRSDGRRFELTPKVLNLGYAYLSSLHVGDIAQPYMEGLSERLHESVSASVLDGDQIVYVARVPTKRIMTIALLADDQIASLERLEVAEPLLDVLALDDGLARAAGLRSRLGEGGGVRVGHRVPSPSFVSTRRLSRDMV